MVEPIMRMTSQIPEEISQIREALIPAAAQLVVVAEAIVVADGLEPQTVTDIQQIQRAVTEFQTDLERHFPIEIPQEHANEIAVFLKKSRHDARNQLNRVFNIVELLKISNDYQSLITHLEALARESEACLAILTSEFRSTKNNPLPPPAPTPLQPPPHAGVILIADDDEENRNLLARLLEPAGHTLHFAKDGEEAIEKVGLTAFDAVLLDIQMPKMDGFEVLESLRESGHLQQTPVIVVTGLQEEQDAVRCIEIGAEDFLSRPIRPALLMARLNASLEKKRLREQVFEQYFTPELARELARNPDPMKMQARNEEVSVLFCDVREFAIISARLGPARSVEWLSEIMGEFSSHVLDLGGVLVDYIGDELMAMWGAPNHQPNHAELACRAGLAMLDSLEKLNEKWAPIVGSDTRVGVGINSGEALVGNIGTHRKFKYGPLGISVNLASRVQGATKYLKTPLLITGNTKAHLDESYHTRRLCQVRMQSFQEPVDLYELVGDDIDQHWADQKRRYEIALKLFERNKLRSASAMLSNVLFENQNDGPCLQLMSLVVNAMLKDLPKEEFSSVWSLPGK